MNLLIIIIENGILFITSRFISKAIFIFGHTITHSQSVASRLLAFIFFPGTLLHELSHWGMAKILFVHTGRVELMPEIHEDGLKLGSVQIARVDPIRRFLIGVAPLIVGSLLLGLISYYMLPYILNFSFTTSYLLLATCYIYVLFVISNTMFSSKKDMEGASALLIFIIFVITILFVAGRGEWIVTAITSIVNNPITQQYSNTIVMLLLIPVGINIGISILFKISPRKR
ncbi:MAG TPA: hypothetical protein PLD54_01190 [Candidatus Levybacteria bacterium]|nr:hypothetical protein [Candidatus Levybacteria bacterium]